MGLRTVRAIAAPRASPCLTPRDGPDRRCRTAFRLMRTLAMLRVLTAAAAAGMLSCGSESPPPEAPREARFVVNASQGTEFDVVEIRSAHAIHRPCLDDAHFQAPYYFILENAELPVQGRFQPLSDAIDNVQLLLGGETVPRRVDAPDATTPIFTGNAPAPIDPTAPACTSESTNGAPEVRFDVSGTIGSEFVATIGDQESSHIVGVVTRVPTTFFIEDASERVIGYFTKGNPDTVLSVRLLVDGTEVDAETSSAGGAGNLVLRFEF